MFLRIARSLEFCNEGYLFFSPPGVPQFFAASLLSSPRIYHNIFSHKVRKIYDGVVAGFAGSTADAMALFDLLEAKLEATNGVSPRFLHLELKFLSDKFF